MDSYPKPVDDRERVAALAELAILDTAPDENFDRIVRLCRTIFHVPVAVVSLVDEDRQWFKSIEGLDVCETSRDLAFCNYTILGDAVFEVTDATQDERFASNALVVGEPFIRYYAGAPLVYDGARLGSLCLIDYAARPPLDADGCRILQLLAEVVIREIRLQRLLRTAVAAIGGAESSNSPD